MHDITENQVYWSFIHILGFTYNTTSVTEQQKANCSDAFQSMFEILSMGLLPNRKYCLVLSNFIREYPIEKYLHNSTQSFKYTFLLHSYVNQLKKTRGQPVKEITFDQAVMNQSELSIDIWGSVFWNMSHRIAAGVPDELTPQHAKAVKIYWSALQFLLPCPECRGHLVEYLKQFPVAIESKDALVEWTWRFHNATNTRLNKPLSTLEFAKSQYDSQVESDLF